MGQSPLDVLFSTYGKVRSIVNLMEYLPPRIRRLPPTRGRLATPLIGTLTIQSFPSPKSVPWDTFFGDCPLIAKSPATRLHYTNCNFKRKTSRRHIAHVHRLSHWPAASALCRLVTAVNDGRRRIEARSRRLIQERMLLRMMMMFVCVHGSMAVAMMARIVGRRQRRPLVAVHQCGTLHWCVMRRWRAMCTCTCAMLCCCVLLARVMSVDWRRRYLLWKDYRLHGFL